MSESSALEILLKTTEGQFFVVVIFMVFVFGIFSKEKLVKLDGVFWLFGVAARTIQKIRRDAVEYDISTTEGEIKSLRKRINDLEVQRKKDLKTVMEEVDRLKRSESIQHQYIIYVIAWARDLETWAATEGITLPPPKLIPYLEFRDKLLKGVDNDHLE